MRFGDGWNHLASLIPKNSSPLFAFATSSSSSLASALVHLTSPRSSAFFPDRMACSKADFLAFSAAIRRGSEWPVKMTNPARGGRLAYSLRRRVSSAERTSVTSACSVGSDGNGASTTVSGLDLFVIPRNESMDRLHV